MCCGESKGEDHTIKTSLFCRKYLWVSELQKLWLWDSLLWIKLHQVNCHRFLWIRGPGFPTKWHLRRDQINCRELKYSETTSVLKNERGNVNFRREARSTSVHPRKNEGKNTKAGGVTELKGQWICWRSCRVRLITYEEQSKGRSLPRKKTSKK